MAQTINTNLISLNAQRNLNATGGAMATAMQRLSSGLRVNSAKDDAAGLAISERMNSQIRGMNVAIRNANDGISLSQTADGALGQISEMLQRMRELGVQAMNATNGASDVGNLQSEFAQLNAELTRTIANTSFNGTAILNAATTLNFQVGAGTTANDQISVSTVNMTTVLSSVSSSNLSTSASAAVNAIDSALDNVNTQRAVFGAAQNRLSAAVSSLQVSVENMSAARGRIVDADFAQETANMTRAQVLQQAGTAMLAQANQVPNSVLQLLKG